MKHWLVKSEPNVFSVDDLAACPDQTRWWKHVRNYQARNILRDKVAVGDEVLIYHSSCKLVGVAGTGKVVQAAYADPDQFNPESKYYDPKASEDNVRWYCVDVVFGEKFPQVLALKTIKAMPGLEDMVLLKQGRLSVQPVTTKEWQQIVKAARRL